MISIYDDIRKAMKIFFMYKEKRGYDRKNLIVDEKFNEDMERIGDLFMNVTEKMVMEHTRKIK